LANGTPTIHLVKAALRAGALIDRYGSPISGTRVEYLLYPSDALYPPGDLLLGQRLLLDCGLLEETDEGLVPTEAIRVLLALGEENAVDVLFDIANRRVGGLSPEIAGAIARQGTAFDPDRRERLLLARRLTFDQARSVALGLLGETHVVDEARAELVLLGRADLAGQVQRVSELSDQLGYDIIAPALNGMRRLEVKTSGRVAGDPFHLFLSRLEFEVGQSDRSWALVACQVNAVGEVAVVGWCRAGAFQSLLPSDSTNAEWVTVEVSLPLAMLNPGLPPAV
jgi:hypothetical protein